MDLITSLLDEADVPYRLHEHAPFLSEADWRASDFPEDRALKTWAGMLPDGRLVLVGLPGTEKLSYGALARALGVSRASLRPASPDDLSRVGMAPGGVCPVARGDGVVVLLDEHLPGDSTLFCGGGRPELTLEITTDDLCRAVPVRWAAVTA